MIMIMMMMLTMMLDGFLVSAVGLIQLFLADKKLMIFFSQAFEPKTLIFTQTKKKIACWINLKPVSLPEIGGGGEL